MYSKLVFEYNDTVSHVNYLTCFIMLTILRSWSMRRQIANKEQLVLCFCWVDANLEPHESFVELYEIQSTEAKTILTAIKDVMLRPDRSVTKLRGQFYNGAASLAGKCKGVSKQIQREEPRALYLHFYIHPLTCSDAIIEGCAVVKNALEVCYEIIQLVKKSSRHDAMLKQMKENCHSLRCHQLLCMSRWIVSTVYE